MNGPLQARFDGLFVPSSEERSGEGALDEPCTFGLLLLRLVAEVAQESAADAVALRIAEVFVRRLGARTAQVYECDDARRPLRRLAFYRAAPEQPRAGDESAEGDALAARAVQAGLLLLSQATVRVDGEVAGSELEVRLAFPLFAGTLTIGAVNAVFDRFPHHHGPELRTLSHALGALLGRAHLDAEVARVHRDARSHSDGVAVVAHDLRQPLSTMVLNTSLLARHTEPRYQPIVDRLSRGMALFERMISDLNDVSLLVSGKFTLYLAAVDLEGLVRGAVAAYAPNARLRCDDDIPHVGADPLRIEQVLMNLLGNAAKHGAPARPPMVDVARRDLEVVVSVTNEGEAIAEEDRSRVFDPYYRAGARVTTGLGLGLFICKSLVEEHGGRIWTDGAEGRTRFCFSLPIVQASSEDSAVRIVVGARV